MCRADWVPITDWKVYSTGFSCGSLGSNLESVIESVQLYIACQVSEVNFETVSTVSFLFGVVFPSRKISFLSLFPFSSQALSPSAAVFEVFLNKVFD